MSKNVRLDWTLPTPTANQRPLKEVVIEARADGVEQWSEVNRVAVPKTTLLVQDLAPGTWEFRGSVVDVDGKESSALAATVSLAFDGPSPLTEFTATVE